MNYKELILAKPGLTIELELLIRCCEIRLGKSFLHLFDSPGVEAIDWQRFLDLTGKHRLFPLVNHVFKQFQDDVPAEVNKEIEKKASRSLKLMLKLAGELIPLHDLLNQHKINFISLKGPLMILQLYGDYSFRQTRDLDILVNENEIDLAISVLSGIGYRLQDTYFLKNQEKRKLYLKRENHVRLFNHEKKIMLELHWAVSKYFVSIKTEKLFENAAVFCASGKNFTTLNTVDYFVYLATHGIYHRYELLFWLYDIAQILSLPETKIPELLSKAEEYHCKRAVKVSVLLASLIFKLELPADCPELFELDSRESFIFNECLQTIVSPLKNEKRMVKQSFYHTLNQRIKHIRFLLQMTSDKGSKKRILTNVFIKPYVWEDAGSIPKNNLIYLILTQIRWIKLVLSGRMKNDGKIRKKEFR